MASVYASVDPAKPVALMALVQRVRVVEEWLGDQEWIRSRIDWVDKNPTPEGRPNERTRSPRA